LAFSGGGAGGGGAISKPHPSPLVETASLTAVRCQPPTFPLADSLGPVAAAGLLSAAQLESVLCACEAHSWRIRGQVDGAATNAEACLRAGFALGDGAGHTVVSAPHCVPLLSRVPVRL
jgi:hypothetical protein